ncbi:hypothetical protein [Paenibacillus sp. QZ-Y1]|uniref:hypothetical protein n=1 Tax=Paenibacillus sp. QZ-Y1 TaxID=3414511 RepID=UPI003F7A2729
MKKELFVIELVNGEFASFIQESDVDNHVVSTPNYYHSKFMKEDFAKQAFNHLINKTDGWYYYGDCLEPKVIRKIIVELI